ncbi:(deoxy)nucleoside triphosphate pyrophosphohydrolase [Owenweeksia hongkongensis]|uniref:(deoxy)nucleoside triphosphate pyrophosphohydrolase n=1 Tax=Owenweeksia hongkongensis TaxID=253245 RepID=UPI003A93A1A4
MIRVVCAIIKNADGKLLFTQRSGKMDHSYHWEFPGGKVENDETDYAAITREIWEELQIEVEPLKKLTQVDWQYPNKKIALVPIICEIRSGTLNLNEHLDFVWLAINELAKLNVLGADREVVNNLKRVYEN